MSKFTGVNIPFEFIGKTTHKDRASVIRSLDRLEKKGMTYNHKRGVYRFSIPMFQEYLVKASLVSKFWIQWEILRSQWFFCEILKAFYLEDPHLRNYSVFAKEVPT